MSTIDAIVQRRSPEWYIGKAIFLTGATTTPDWPEGYYRVRGIHPDGSSDVERLPGMPAGEPVYIHDGSRDLKAIPSTVKPPTYEFALWWGGYVVALAFMVYVSADSVTTAFIFWSLVLLPLLGGPYYTWYVNIEPVRGTKTSLAIFGAQGALAIKQRHDKQEMARMSQKLKDLGI